MCTACLPNTDTVSEHWWRLRPAAERKGTYRFSTSAHAASAINCRWHSSFYMRDRRGEPQFIGESRIDHTPMGSTLSLVTATLE